MENEQVSQEAPAEITVPQAMKVIITALSADKEPGSYYHSWQANIAMAMSDEWMREIRSNKGAVRDINATCNQAAKNFMDLLISQPS